MDVVQERSDLGDRVDAAIRRLKTFRDEDAAVVDLLSCGPAAIEPLRELLFNREPSGLYRPRCLAAETLGCLGAREVLTEFLLRPRTVEDPVEQTGEEAVTNAAARALGRWKDDATFDLLLGIGRERTLSGVVAVLADFGRTEAIPAFSAALAEDFTRPAAEEGFRRLGPAARPELLRLACSRPPVAIGESETSRRLRRAALRLLAELPNQDAIEPALIQLVNDPDPEVSCRAAALCLPALPEDRRRAVTCRLLSLRDSRDWHVAQAAEEALVRHHLHECPDRGLAQRDGSSR